MLEWGIRRGRVISRASSPGWSAAGWRSQSSRRHPHCRPCRRPSVVVGLAAVAVLTRRALSRIRIFLQPGRITSGDREGRKNRISPFRGLRPRLLAHLRPHSGQSPTFRAIPMTLPLRLIDVQLIVRCTARPVRPFLADREGDVDSRRRWQLEGLLVWIWSWERRETRSHLSLRRGSYRERVGGGRESDQRWPWAHRIVSGSANRLASSPRR